MDARPNDPAFWQTLYRKPQVDAQTLAAVAVRADGVAIAPDDLEATIAPEPELPPETQGALTRMVDEQVMARLADLLQGLDAGALHGLLVAAGGGSSAGGRAAGPAPAPSAPGRGAASAAGGPGAASTSGGPGPAAAVGGPGAAAAQPTPAIRPVSGGFAPPPRLEIEATGDGRPPSSSFFPAFDELGEAGDTATPRTLDPVSTSAARATLSVDETIDLTVEQTLDVPLPPLPAVEVEDAGVGTGRSRAGQFAEEARAMFDRLKRDPAVVDGEPPEARRSRRASLDELDFVIDRAAPDLPPPPRGADAVSGPRPGPAAPPPRSAPDDDVLVVVGEESDEDSDALPDEHTLFVDADADDAADDADDDPDDDAADDDADDGAGDEIAPPETDGDSSETARTGARRTSPRWDRVPALRGGPAALMQVGHLEPDAIRVLVRIDGVTSLRGLRDLASGLSEAAFLRAIDAADSAQVLDWDD